MSSGQPSQPEINEEKKLTQLHALTNQNGVHQPVDSNYSELNTDTRLQERTSFGFNNNRPANLKIAKSEMRQNEQKNSPGMRT